MFFLNKYHQRRVFVDTIEWFHLTYPINYAKPFFPDANHNECCLALDKVHNLQVMRFLVHEYENLQRNGIQYHLHQQVNVH